MAVQSELDHENRGVVKEARNGDKMHQRWKILYADVAGPVKTSGFSKNWGMYLNRPFHIVSFNQSGRMLDMISNRVVLKTRNGRPTQIWEFDWKTRTIKNKGYPSATNNYALDMRNSNVLYAYTVNSYWY